MEFEDVEPTVKVRTLQLVIYRGEILTMNEYIRILKLKYLGENMDKKIRSIKKKVKKDAGQEEKELGELEKLDKKRDKVCELGEKVLKKSKK